MTDAILAQFENLVTNIDTFLVELKEKRIRVLSLEQENEMLKQENAVLQQENYELRALPDAPDYFEAKARFNQMSEPQN